MDVTIGIIAYNEENNIKNLIQSLQNQKLSKIKIKKIIVVSSGSTDNTNRIIKKLIKKDKKIEFIIQKKRLGKASGINEFLKIAKSNILILSSADIIPKKDAIENLCNPLIDKKIGICGCRPIPRINNQSIIGNIVKLQWLLHHKISIIKPKFGEMVAFRNIIKKIKNTAADEEYIAMKIKQNNLKGYYAKNAIINNYGPKNISDLIKQRRRIHWGHLELIKKNTYKTASLNYITIFKEIIKIIKVNNFYIIIFAIILEGYSRLLGSIDYYINKNYYIWEISKSTKK